LRKDSFETGLIGNWRQHFLEGELLGKKSGLIGEKVH
jgi:hypothetical protein